VLEVRASCGFCVVYDAINGVAYDAFGVKASADCVGFHPDSDQIVTLKALQSFFPADSHAFILRFLDEKNPAGGGLFLLGIFGISGVSSW
jgi:hypothetical protein